MSVFTSAAATKHPWIITEKIDIGKDVQFLEGQPWVYLAIYKPRTFQFSCKEEGVFSVVFLITHCHQNAGWRKSKAALDFNETVLKDKNPNLVVLWVADGRWRGRGREPSEAGGERQTGKYLFDSDGEQGPVFPRSVPANIGCSRSMLQVRPAGTGDNCPVPPAPISIFIPGRQGHLSSILGLASCPQTPPCQSPRVTVVTLHIQWS